MKGEIYITHMTDQNLVGEISKGAVSLDVLSYKYHKYTIVKHVKLFISEGNKLEIARV